MVVVFVKRNAEDNNIKKKYSYIYLNDHFKNKQIKKIHNNRNATQVHIIVSAKYRYFLYITITAEDKQKKIAHLLREHTSPFGTLFLAI